MPNFLKVCPAVSEYEVTEDTISPMYVNFVHPIKNTQYMLMSWYKNAGLKVVQFINMHEEM